MNPPRRIAIIGAGPAGLFAARSLRQQGYDQITLYERAGLAAANSRSAVVDGHDFDFSTKFVPNWTLAGDDLHRPPLVELMRDAGATLLPSAEAFFYDPAARAVPKVPFFLRGHGKLKIARDCIAGALLCLRLEGQTSVADVYRLGLARPSENVLAWGERLGIQAFAAVLAYLSDMFGGAPAVQHPVGFLLMSRHAFIWPYLRRILTGGSPRRGAALAAGLRLYARRPGCADDERDRLHRLARLLAAPPSHNNQVVQGGYSSFFQRLWRREGLSVRFGAALRPIEYTGPGPVPAIRLTTEDGASETYDALLLACGPRGICELMGARPALPALFRDVAPAHVIRTFLFRGRGWPAAIASRGILLDDSNRARLGRADLALDTVCYGVSREYEDSDVLVAPTYSPPGASDEEAARAFSGHCRALGFSVDEVLRIERFEYPRYVPMRQVEEGWFDRLERLQGLDNTFVLGDTLCGTGVPAVLAHTTRFIAERFPARGAARREARTGFEAPAASARAS